MRRLAGGCRFVFDKALASQKERCEQGEKKLDLAAANSPRTHTRMAKIRMATQFGMGTSLRRQDYTEAAARAIRDALWHNSLSIADAFGFPKEAMIIDVEIGVQRPDAVDTQALLQIFPYGRPSIKAVEGGLDVSRPNGSGVTVIANAAIMVSFDMERSNG